MRVSDYFRLQRWEIPRSGDEQPAELGGRVPVDAHLRGPAGGLVIGGLLSAVDSLGGMTAGLAVLPRWIVTTNMMATLVRPSHAGPLRLHSRVVRRGRNSVVVAVDIVDEGDHDRAVAMVVQTCAVLDADRRDLHFDRPVVVDMPPEAASPVVPAEFFGIEPEGGPVTRLTLSDHLRNPWGILHGGAVAVLADIAATRAVADRDRPGEADLLATGDVVLHYLRPSRTGPIDARCTVLGGGSGRHVVRVELRDVGAGDRVVGTGSVEVLDWSGAPLAIGADLPVGGGPACGGPACGSPA